MIAKYENNFALNTFATKKACFSFCAIIGGVLNVRYAKNKNNTHTREKHDLKNKYEYIPTYGCMYVCMYVV